MFLDAANFTTPDYEDRCVQMFQEGLTHYDRESIYRAHADYSADEWNVEQMAKFLNLPPPVYGRYGRLR